MNRAEAGFTLIELLAALVAGSLVLMVLGWNVAALGRELRSARQQDDARQASAAAAVLTRLVEQAIPADNVLVTERGRLVLASAPPQALGASGPLEVTFSVRSERGRRTLLVAFAPLAASAALPLEITAAAPLLSGYRSIDFDYAEPNGAGLPRLVTLKLVDGSGRRTRIAAAPRTNTRGDCRFDPISLTCRP